MNLDDIEKDYNDSVAKNPRSPLDDVESDYAESVKDSKKKLKAAQADESLLPPAVSEIGRQLGLTARDVLEGHPYVSLPLAAGDLANTGVNYGIRGINKLAGSKIDELAMPSQIYSNALTDVGLPLPKDSTERVVNNTAKGLIGAGGSVQAGANMINSASPMIANMGKSFVSNPVAQGVAGAAGSGAASIAQENGASPAMQTLIGLGTSLTPAIGAATAENAFNRLVSNPANMERNIAAFRGAGTSPTIGQATQSPIAQNIESFLSKIPGSSHIMTKKAEEQAAQIGDKINELSSNLSPRITSTSAGRAIYKDIKGEGGFVDNFKKTADTLYSKLDDHIEASTPVPVENTKQILASLNGDIPGAREVSKLFKNSKIQGIESALRKDISAGEPTTLENAYLNAFPQSNAFNPTGKQSIKIPATESEGRFLPYEAVQKLRTLVGKQLNSNELMSGAPNSHWKALYGALSKDLGEAANTTSPEAARAWNKANSFYKAGADRMELLDSVVNKDTPEAVYKAAISGNQEGATNLNAVMQSLSSKGKKAVTANLLKNIGKATAGNQDDLGSTFSTNTFLTNLNRLSPEAKQSLFARNSYGQDFGDTIKSIASTANNLKTGSKVFQNSSGTAPANELIRMGLSLLKSPVMVAGKIAGTNRLAKHMTSADAVKNLNDYEGFNLSPHAKAIVANQLLQNRTQ